MARVGEARACLAVGVVMRDRSDRLVVLSQNVFPATGTGSLDGFVATEGNRIVAVGPRGDARPYVDAATRVIDAGERTVLPGMTDNHTFFAGWALLSLGCDLSHAHDVRVAIEALLAFAQPLGEGEPVFGHGWNAGDFGPDAASILDEAFPDRPVVAFTADRGTCWMNTAARERYGFSPDECYAEKTWRMMGDYLRDPRMRGLYHQYMRMLNARGITQIKEMTFDDYYGFADVMERMERDDELTVRVSMMSQPVGRGMDLEHGRRMRERFRGPFVSFSGFNRMTDRSIGSGMAELKEPYLDDPGSRCGASVEWGLIEDELEAADDAGFRYSLHCQGDAAVAHVVELYGRCRKGDSGRLLQRHAITDLELADPEDIERLGALGGVCEVYPQIQSLDKKADLLAMVSRKIGPKRFGHYWMRRQMWDAGCKVACGTDLPLMLPSIGEAIYCGCGGHFDDGGTAREENMLTVPEMLLAWTANGAYDCYAEDRLGTLEPGKLADIVVLEADVLHADPADVREVNAALTVSDGRVAYDGLT
ncbi:Amidohydrolase 3 [Olsenella uli DSM 7084]|uniref:Amidohydrolase 3 n=2 Tax=Olsenella uli TaxID=133926 RepID=E1QZC5_OLSUV|nr:Amidohydrolase 3 [Olsenella uli DSM 7084]